MMHVEHQMENMVTRKADIQSNAAVHWVRVSAFSVESSPKLTWDAMGLRADSVRRLSVRTEPLTR